jgi:hypothetical protein
VRADPLGVDGGRATHRERGLARLGALDRAKHAVLDRGLDLERLEAAERLVVDAGERERVVQERGVVEGVAGVEAGGARTGSSGERAREERLLRSGVS